MIMIFSYSKPVHPLKLNREIKSANYRWAQLTKEKIFRRDKKQVVEITKHIIDENGILFGKTRLNTVYTVK